jgi:hypothetical protein
MAQSCTEVVGRGDAGFPVLELELMTSHTRCDASPDLQRVLEDLCHCISSQGGSYSIKDISAIFPYQR